MARRLLHAALVLAVACCWSTWQGCASTSPRALGGVGTHMGVQIYLQGKGGQFARWAVNRDGVLRFGGGYAAQRGEWTWQGRLTVAQSDAIDTIVRTARWLPAVGIEAQGHDVKLNEVGFDGEAGLDGEAGFDREAGFDSNADQALWQVYVVGPSTQGSFEVVGPDAAVLAVWSVFEQAGQVRFQAELDHLPSGDLDRYMRERGAQRRTEQQAPRQERE